MRSPEIFPKRPAVAVPCGAVLGESPVWDDRTGTLLWVDIKSRLLFRWRPDGDAAPEIVRFAEQIGFLKLTSDPDTLLVGLQTGLARHDVARGVTTHLLSPEPDRPGNRLNDGGVGPDGSLYFGTMDDAEREPTGSFYHWSEAGLARFGESATVTNGPTVDGVRGLVYTADTQRGDIFVQPLGAAGEPGERRPFARFDGGDGQPDGLTVDREGCLWVCHWGGGRITRFSPEGEPILVVPMPTSRITKVAFGGPDLRTIFVTTASIGLDRETDLQAGHLFAFEAGIAGLPSEPCRMIA